MKDIHDVIKHAKFGDDRLRGSGVVAGQISAVPIDFAGRPYNTLTLPCERVIQLLMTRVQVDKTYVVTCTCVRTRIIVFSEKRVFLKGTNDNTSIFGQLGGQKLFLE